ncbi:MAG TPA: invasin domain 3-containing protein [Gemmatimonadales bacterium]
MTKITYSGAPASRRVRIARFLAVIAACMAAVTCDLVTAPKAGSASGFAFTLTSKPQLVVGEPVPITIDVSQAGTALQGARLDITSDHPNVVDVVTNSDFSHVLNPLARGTAVLTVKLIGSTLGDIPPSDTFAVTVVAHAITATRGSVTMRSLQDTLTFGTKVFDANNVELVGDESAVRWVSESPLIVSIDPITGRATALANGTAILRASIDVDTALDTVTVQQRVAHYTFAPSPVVIAALGATAQITATPKDSGGSTVTLGGLPAVTFTSRRPGSFTVNGTGLVTGNLNDTAFVVATSTVGTGTVIDSVNVEVGQVAQSIVINQTGPINKDALNDSVLISATALDARNQPINTRNINFTSRTPLVARRTTSTSSSAVFALDRTGSSVIAAQLDQAKDSISVVVSNVARTTFVTPDTLKFATVDDTLPLSVKVRNSIGDTVSLATTPVTWRSLDTTIAKVDSTGHVWARSVGTAFVTASITTGTPDTSVIRVQNLPTSVHLAQGPVTLASIGDSISIGTNITNARNKQLGAGSVQWTTTGASVASIGTPPLVTAQGRGSAFIIIADTNNAAHRDSVLVTVTNAPFKVILDHHTDAFQAITTKRQFNATVNNRRGAPIPQQALLWSSSNTTVATVDASGNVTAQGVGTALIFVADTAQGFVADTATVTSANDVDHIIVAQFPSAAIGSLLDTLRLSPTAVNIVGGSVVGVAFRWTSADTSIASVDSVTGLVTGKKVGSVNVTVSIPTAPSVPVVTTRIDVSNQPTSITLLGGPITLANIGDTVLPPASMTNKLGASLPRSAAQWLADNPNVVFVSHDTVIALNRGSTLVRARNSVSTQIQDSVLVTVTNAPVTMNVQPHSDSLPSLGRTKQLAVSVANAHGAAILNEPITWTSSNQAILQVSPTGLVSSVGIGTALVIATAPFNGKADTATIKVSNLAATVAISPASAPLAAVSATMLLTSTPRNEAGGVISGSTPTWTTSNASVAAFLPSGSGSPNGGPASFVRDTMRLVAVGIGTATITATVDGIPTSIVATVGNAPATIQITSPDTTLGSIGDSYQVRTNIRNALNTSLPASAVLWTTADQTVATVSSSGLVTATGRGGPVTVRATSPADGTLFADIHITVSNAPVSLTIAPLTPTLTALGAQTTLTATVRNAAGAIVGSPVPAVTWSTSGSGAATVNAATGVVTAASNGSTTIIATAGSATNSTLATVGQLASGSRSTISASLSSITANGSATSTITVQAKDSLGVSLTASGGTVLLTLTGTGSLSAVTNNGNGTYTATLTAPISVGSGAISGTIAGAAITTGNPQVTYTAAVDTKYVVATSGTTPVAGTQVTISAQLADANNNPVAANPARTVNWTSTGGGSFGSPSSTTSLATGIATVTFTTSTAAGTLHTVTATDGSGRTGTTVTIQTLSGGGNNYVVTPATTSPAAGAADIVTAQLRDNNNNPVAQPGLTVNWTKSSPNGSFSSGGTSLTNSSGIATITLTTHTVSGTATTVTATTPATASGTSGSITTVPGAASVVTTTIGSAVGALPSGGTTTITVTAKDANTNALTSSGGAVTLSTTSGSIGGITDHNDGTYTATFTAGVVGTATISGTVNGFTITSGNPTITVSAGGASQMAINGGNGQTASAGSAVAVQPSVIVRDGSGNPVGAGVNVTFAASGGGTISPVGGVVPTNSSGIATLTSWTLSTTAGPNTMSVTAIFTGATLNFSASGVAGPASAAQSTASIPTGTAGSITTITIQAKDANGNSRTTTSGAVVASVTGGNTATATVVDNLNGTYTATYAPTVSGTSSDVIAITLAGSPISGSPFTVSVNPGAAHHFVVTNTGGTPIGGQSSGSPFNVKVTAQDLNNNTASSFIGTVDISSTGTLSGGSGTTPSFSAGVLASRAVTIANTGNFTITATKTGGGPSGTSNTFPVTGPPSAAQSVASVPAGASNALTTITVQAKDAFGNNRTATSGTVVVSVSGANTATAAVTDNNDGTYSATYTPTASGTDIVAITLGGVAIGGSPYSSVVAAGTATHLVITGSGTQTAGLGQTVTITAKDALNNTATGYSGAKSLTFSGAAVAPAGNAPTATDNGAVARNFGIATSVTFTNGVATSSVVLFDAQSASVSITDGTISTTVHLAVTVSAAAVDNFSWNLTTPQVTAVAFTGTNTLTARDHFNNTVTNFDASADNVTITVAPSGTVSGLSGGAVLNLNADFVNGVADLINALTYTRSAAETSVTFTATNTTAKTGVSAPVTIGP